MPLGLKRPANDITFARTQTHRDTGVRNSGRACDRGPRPLSHIRSITAVQHPFAKFSGHRVRHDHALIKIGKKSQAANLVQLLER